MEYHFKNFSVLENLKKESGPDRNGQCKYVRFDKTIAEDAIRLHKSIPGYGPAPLIFLKNHAAAGMCRLFIARTSRSALA